MGDQFFNFKWYVVGNHHKCFQKHVCSSVGSKLQIIFVLLDFCELIFLQIFFLDMFGDKIMNPKILEMIKCCSTIFSGFSSPCPADDNFWAHFFKFSSKSQETEIMISWKFGFWFSNVAESLNILFKERRDLWKVGFNFWLSFCFNL